MEIYKLNVLGAKRREIYWSDFLKAKNPQTFDEILLYSAHADDEKAVRRDEEEAQEKYHNPEFEKVCPVALSGRECKLGRECKMALPKVR